MIKTTNEARELFAKKNLKYSDLSRDNLQGLRKMINKKMIESGCLEGTFRCKQRVEFRPNHFWAGIKCRSFYFEDREAVSFNPDGFIGFAGWSDSTNIRPILDGFEEWVEWVADELGPEKCKHCGAGDDNHHSYSCPIMVCGCGKRTEYVKIIDGKEVHSCNKYGRCPDKNKPAKE